MEDIPCREDYTYEKFILYLYLCAAYADYEVEESEIDMIKSKIVGSGLIPEDDFNASWQQVLNDFKRHNDIESMDHISGCVNDLKMDEATRLKIFNDLKEIMDVDGEEGESERVNLFRLKKIMGV
jgi:uncharacterized tellurite resistance protein B-like protein